MNAPGSRFASGPRGRGRSVLARPVSRRWLAMKTSSYASVRGPTRAVRSADPGDLQLVDDLADPGDSFCDGDDRVLVVEVGDPAAQHDDATSRLHVELVGVLAGGRVRAKRVAHALAHLVIGRHQLAVVVRVERPLVWSARPPT